MDLSVRKYSLRDSVQEEADKDFWEKQSIEYKIMVLEALRRMWPKIKPEEQTHGDYKGLRRVLRTAKQT